ncbi:MAG: GIY-YIG nuclease family protein [Ignavibacteriales bacterium]|nr:GIY-YIG nuclease family protein [Ignavibacteriales bacterium]
MYLSAREMSYFVYLLWSVRSKCTYVGQTDDVGTRLKRHNAGYIRSTKAYRPWILVRKELYSMRAEAMKRETWLKSPSGRKLVAEFIEKWQAQGLSVALQAPRDRVPTKSGRTKPA